MRPLLGRVGCCRKEQREEQKEDGRFHVFKTKEIVLRQLIDLRIRQQRDVESSCLFGLPVEQQVRRDFIHGWDSFGSGWLRQSFICGIIRVELLGERRNDLKVFTVVMSLQ